MSTPGVTTDFAALQTAFAAAVSRLQRQWSTVTAGQVDELVAQLRAARSSADLAAIAATVPDPAVLAGELHQVLEDGARSVREEAAAQGVTLPAPDLAAAHAAVDDMAAAVAQLMTSSLSTQAASRALAIGVGAMSIDEAEAQFRARLQAMSPATRDYELAGAVTRAQNQGRFVAMDESPPGTWFYASELNDSHGCELCAEIDGTRFASMEEARRDYPVAGYVGCEGGNRCRGTLVAVHPQEI